MADSATRQYKPTVLTNVIRRKQEVLDNEEIVLTTQLGASRFPILLVQLDYWRGSASVAVHMTSKDDMNIFFSFVDENQEALQNTSFHAVLEKTKSTTRPYYPHNILRNVAMETIESDYFVALDVDFIPAVSDCHSGLMDLLKKSESSMREELRTRRRLFILPAFELFARPGETQATQDMLPKSKEELLEGIKNQTMRPFEKSFAKGHRATNFPKWQKLVENRTNQDFYTISSKRKKASFEPYALGFKPGIPRFWDLFRGYGWNKISFFQECIAAGYEFAVLLNSYCIHTNHPDSPTKSKHEMSESNIPYWNHYSEYISERYSKKDVTGTQA